ncbi:hypothetical protein FDUTEX481_01487 [Tolypothrix sp. PCC 7601]|nr:hypothetical protein FDUTEX481_01487 [Tolypothrix sp. PCC 7601]
MRINNCRLRVKRVMGKGKEKLLTFNLFTVTNFVFKTLNRVVLDENSIGFG